MQRIGNFKGLIKARLSSTLIITLVYVWLIVTSNAKGSSTVGTVGTQTVQTPV